MRSRSKWAIVAGLCCCLATVGCGKGASVSGKVVYEKDGSPLTGGTVMFVSEDSHLARADVHGDGTFELKSQSGDKSLQPGKYSVCLTPPDTSALRENGVNVAPVLDARFQSTATSGLQFEVKPGKNDFTIKVSKPAGG